MKIKKTFGYLFLLGIMLSMGSSFAQETFPKNDVLDARPDRVALTHATIVTAPTQVLENAMLVIQDGKVVSVQAGNQVPNGYLEIDLSGRYIYPSFIDMFGEYGQPEVKRPPLQEPCSQQGADTVQYQGTLQCQRGHKIAIQQFRKLYHGQKACLQMEGPRIWCRSVHQKGWNCTGNRCPSSPRRGYGKQFGHQFQGGRPLLF